MAKWTGVAERKKFTRPAFIWIPKAYQNLNWILKIDGTTIPRTKIFGIKYSHAVTDEIGQCKIELNNNDGTYSYTGGETIEIYVDYSDASTLRWKGEVEKAEPAFQEKGRTLKITGRHISARLLDITVTESYSDEDVADILDDLVDGGDYTSDFSYAKTATGTTASINWENKPFWECVVDLCNLVQYDCYVDTSDAFQFAKKGSTINSTEAMVHGNILEISGLGTDTVKVRNKIIVNGVDDDGTPIVYTAEDSSSQSAYQVKEKIITDTSINTAEDAKNRAVAELALLKETETAGEAVSMIMVDLNPGEKVWISYPMLNVHDTYRVVKFETNLYSSPPKTKVWINSVKKIPSLFKNMMKRDLATEEIQNPQKMKFSFNMTFDDTSQISTSTNVETSEGVLKTTAGNNVGNMISVTTTADNNITSAYIVPKGNALSGNTILYYLSNNGGQSWEIVSSKTLHTFTSTGNQLRVKIEMNSASVELDSISVMYL